MKKIYELIFFDHKIKINGQFYYYYAAFNAPCVGHKDDESQAQYNRGFSFLADAASPTNDQARDLFVFQKDNTSSHRAKDTCYIQQKNA